MLFRSDLTRLDVELQLDSDRAVRLDGDPQHSGQQFRALASFAEKDATPDPSPDKDADVQDVVIEEAAPIDAGSDACLELCPKGNYAHEFIHSEDRLTKPLIKKDGKFVEASWDEAYDTIVKNYKKYKDLAPEAVKRGCVVIDKSSAFRMDPAVPLVVPEINADALRGHRGIIASPNCSTAVALMALYPLHVAFGLRRVFFSTYQSVSGTGADAVKELFNTLEKLQQQSRQLENDPRFKLMAQAARAPGAENAGNGNALQKQIQAMQDALGKAAGQPDALAKLKDDLAKQFDQAKSALADSKLSDEEKQNLASALSALASGMPAFLCSAGGMNGLGRAASGQRAFPWTVLGDPATPSRPSPGTLSTHGTGFPGCSRRRALPGHLGTDGGGASRVPRG